MERATRTSWSITLRWALCVAIAIVGSAGCAGSPPGPSSEPVATATDEAPSMIPIGTRPTEEPVESGVITEQGALSQPMDPDDADDVRDDNDPEADPANEGDLGPSGSP